MKKLRQHHVWQHYLKSWATDGALYCLREGRIFPTGTRVVAVENEFYKLPPLTMKDIEQVRWLLGNGGSGLSKTMREDFLKLMTVSALAELRYTGPKRDPHIAAILDEQRTNAIEDYHMIFEGMFVPLLDRIHAEDIGFYSEMHDSITFLMFVSLQFLRTKGLKERMIARQTTMLVDMTRIWGMLSVVLALTLAGALVHDRPKRKLALIRNKTPLKFITGDQPVANLLAKVDAAKSPEEISLYYPVSPDLALILSAEDKAPLFSTETLTEASVLTLNDKIHEVTHSQMFGHSKAALTRYL